MLLFRAKLHNKTRLIISKRPLRFIPIRHILLPDHIPRIMLIQPIHRLDNLIPRLPRLLLFGVQVIRAPGVRKNLRPVAFPAHKPEYLRDGPSLPC